MMSHPILAEIKRMNESAKKFQRLEDERQANIMRLIAYNNRRVRAGLAPLDIPITLAAPSDWYRPGNRDNIPLVHR